MNRHLYPAAVVALWLAACGSPSETSDSGGIGGLALNITTAASTSLDAGRVTVSGPTNKTVSATPGAQVTVDGLAPGTYTVTLEGLVAGAVDQFGQITGVQVVAGQNKQITATLTSFRPVISDPTLSPDGLQFEVAFPAVPAADSYRVEVATSANFSGSVGSNVTANSATFPINNQFGDYFIRALAFDPLRNTGRFSDSIKVTISNLGSTASLDGWAENTGNANANGGGPLVGDVDAFNPNRQLRQLYSFDLTGLPSGAAVSSGVLRLFQATVAGSPYTALGNVVVDHLDYGLVLDGTDFGLAALQSNIGTLSNDATTGYKTLDVTTSVQNDRAASRPHSQFRLRFSTADGNNDGVNDFAAFGDAELSCCATDSVPELILVTH